MIENSLYLRLHLPGILPIQIHNDQFYWFFFKCNETKITYFSVFEEGLPEDVGMMTAENKVGIDKSDLIPKVLTLNVGDEFCGVVAHIQTPGDFFCQQLQSGRK